MKAGTEKSRIDRHRISCNLTVNYFSGNKKHEKNRKSTGARTVSVKTISRPYSRFVYLSRKILTVFPY
jgi:hypothetical protein